MRGSRGSEITTTAKVDAWRARAFTARREQRTRAVDRADERLPIDPLEDPDAAIAAIAEIRSGE